MCSYISGWQGRWICTLCHVILSACHTAKILYRKFETYVYSQKGNCTATVPIPTFMFLCAIYIFPWSVCIFCCKKWSGPIVGIYKSLTATWMWKLGLRPRSSFFRKYINFFGVYTISTVSEHVRTFSFFLLPISTTMIINVQWLLGLNSCGICHELGDW